MAMVLITNGEITSKVPAAAFNTQYKKLGFRIVADEIDGEQVPSNGGTSENVEDGTEVTSEGEVADEAEDVEDNAEDEGDNEEEEDEQDKDAEEAAFVEDILEKPLSQWSVDELKEFVRIKDIDTTGAKKTSEVRAIVKKFLEAQDKAAVNS